MPRVRPSATPLNNEKVPSVTISGGNWPCNHQRVQSAAKRTYQQGRGDGQWHRQVLRRATSFKHDCRQPHHRSDREIYASGYDDRRERKRQEPKLDRQPRNLERVPCG